MALDGLGERFAVANPRAVRPVSAVHGVNELFSLALPAVLPLVIAEFDLTYARAGLLVATYFGTYAVLQAPAGVLADRPGQRRLIAAGTAVTAVGMALASVAPTAPVLFGSVALAGVGGSSYHPAGMGFVSDVEPDATAGRAMGVHELAGVVGNLLAPAFTGGIAAATNRRLALGATAGVGVVAAVAFGVLSDADRSTGPSSGGADQRGSGDERGRAEASGRERGRESAGDPDREGPRAGARGREPRSRLGRLRDDLGRLVGLPLAWWVLGLFLAKLLFTLQSYGVRTYLTSYVVERLGSSTGTANATFVAYLAGTALATVLFGALADRFDRRRLLAGTFLLGAAFVAATALVPAGAATFLAWFFVTGAAAYASLPVMNTLVSEHSERAFSGSLFGVVQTASALGGTVGPLLLGAVASRVGIRATFPLIAVVGVVGALGFLAAGSDRLVARVS